MNHFRKLTAAVAALFMAIGVMGTLPVFAETNTTLPTTTSGDTVSVPITKLLESRFGEDVLPADSLTYDFTVTRGAGLTYYDRDQAPGTVFSGTVDNGEVTITPGTWSGDDRLTYRGSLDIHPSKFPGPGIFQYTLMDKVDVDGYLPEGFIDQVEFYSVKVAIERKDGQLAVQGVVAEKGAESGKAVSLSFEATYYPSYLLVRKDLEGNQAVDTDEFTFQLAVTGEKGKTYRWAVYPDLDSERTFDNCTPSQTGTIVSGQTATGIKMRKGWHLAVFGLISTDSCTLTETGTLGYTPDPDRQGKEIRLPEAGHVPANQRSGYSIKFVNKKEGTVPTGILMTWAPYVLVAGLAVIFGVLFFGRRRHND